MRALFNHAVVVDTTRARHVWEHPSFPQFYVPIEDILGPAAVVKLVVDQEPLNALDDSSHGSDSRHDGGQIVSFAKLHVRHMSTDRVLVFDKGPLAGLVRFDFAAMGRCFLEGLAAAKES